MLWSFFLVKTLISRNFWQNGGTILFFRKIFREINAFITEFQSMLFSRNFLQRWAVRLAFWLFWSFLWNVAQNLHKLDWKWWIQVPSTFWIHWGQIWPQHDLSLEIFLKQLKNHKFCNYLLLEVMRPVFIGDLLDPHMASNSPYKSSLPDVLLRNCYKKYFHFSIY